MKDYTSAKADWKKELHAFCIGNDGSDENWYKLSEPQLSVFIETLLLEAISEAKEEEREKTVKEILNDLDGVKVEGDILGIEEAVRGGIIEPIINYIQKKYSKRK